MTTPYCELLIIVPTRLRPHTLAPLAKAFDQTCRTSTTLLFAVDDCPRFAEYSDEFSSAHLVYPWTGLVAGPRRRLVGTLNFYALDQVALEDRPFAIGYMGDDHRPLTPGWDAAYVEELHRLGTGLVYGNDLHQGRHLPTQVAMTSDIIAELGYMAPPALTHMYCDNFWLDLGQAANCITYLPDVVVQHRHPSTGFGDWDASYRESNSTDMYSSDATAYREYRRTQLAVDAQKVVSLRECHTSAA